MLRFIIKLHCHSMPVNMKKRIHLCYQCYHQNMHDHPQSIKPHTCIGSLIEITTRSGISCEITGKRNIIKSLYTTRERNIEYK